MPYKKELTQEMILDFGLIGDMEFSQKWGVSRRWLIKERKKINIKPFVNQFGLRPHQIIDGVECKWCGAGHWEPVSNFGVHSNRYDKLRGHCKTHESESGKRLYHKNDRVNYHRGWRKTDVGKESLRMTWRKQKSIKENAFVLWSKKIEKLSFSLFEKSCAYCRRRLTFLTVEFDHVIPIKLGGKTEPMNMVPCCMNCNHGQEGKFTREAMEWMIEKFGEKQALRNYRYIRSKLKLLREQLI